MLGFRWRSCEGVVGVVVKSLSRRLRESPGEEPCQEGPETCVGCFERDGNNQELLYCGVQRYEITDTGINQKKQKVDNI